MVQCVLIKFLHSAHVKGVLHGPRVIACRIKNAMMLGRTCRTGLRGGTGNALPVAVGPRGCAPAAHDLLLLRNTDNKLSVPPEMRASMLHVIVL